MLAGLPQAGWSVCGSRLGLSNTMPACSAMSWRGMACPLATYKGAAVRLTHHQATQGSLSLSLHSCNMTCLAHLTRHVQARGPVDLEAAGHAVQEQLGSHDWDLGEIERQKVAQVCTQLTAHVQQCAGCVNKEILYILSS